LGTHTKEVYELKIHNMHTQERGYQMRAAVSKAPAKNFHCLSMHACTGRIRSDFCIPKDFDRLRIQEGQPHHLGDYSSIRIHESTVGALFPSLQYALISSVSEVCQKRISLLFCSLSMLLVWSLFRVDLLDIRNDEDIYGFEGVQQSLEEVLDLTENNVSLSGLFPEWETDTQLSWS
jgi:hypothetical protein